MTHRIVTNVIRAAKGRRPTARRSFTLIEVVVSMAITSILLAAVMSAMVMVARTLDESSPTQRTTDAAEALARLVEDLRTATAITERTSTAVTMVSPDRNADGSPETIRYAWSGVAGEPLTRTVNGGTSVSILDNVQSIDLAFTVRSLGPSPLVTSAETLLLSHDANGSGSLSTFTFTDTDWACQYIRPTLPPNATAWRITRVRMKLATNGPTGSKLQIQFRRGNALGMPTGEILESITLNESQLPVLVGWYEVTPTTLSGLSPAYGVCVVVLGLTAGTNAGRWAVHEGGTNMKPGTHWLDTANKGVTWSMPTDTRDACIQVYGSYTTEGAPW